MTDTIVFDIETKNFFTDEGVGWNNFEALRISVVSIYSYEKQKYFCFGEHELNQLVDFFKNSKRLVGFSINKYDIPVLNIYFQKMNLNPPLNLWEKERIDLLEEIENIIKERISLSKLSEINLGIKKDRKGEEAPILYSTGQIEELKKYCLKDVEITKGLYDLYQNEKKLFFPDKKTGQKLILDFSSKTILSPNLF